MKKLGKRLRERGIERYTIYELDKPFPFYLLDLKKLGISLPCAPYFKYITMELWWPRYGINFYDEEEMLVARVNIGFTEKSVIEYFNELLLDISQEMKKGECNG